MWRPGSQLSGAPAPRRPRSPGCDRAVPVAAPCAPGFGLRSGPVRGLGGSGAGHTSSRPGPWRPAPAESGRRAGGASGAAGVSARSPGARLCARAGRGRAVTRRARRIPDSRPPLRPPRTSSHRSPGSSRRRTVSTRVRSPATRALCLCSFFRLVRIWVLVMLFLLFIPKDSMPHSHAVRLPPRRPLQAHPLKPQEPERAPQAALAAAPGRCVQLIAGAFRSGPRNSIPFLRFPLPLVLGPRAPSTRENPAGPQDPQLGEDALGSEALRSLHAGRTHLPISGKTRRHRHFPEPRSPGHLPSLPESCSGGCGACLADPSARELGQCFYLLGGYKGLQRERRVNLFQFDTRDKDETDR